MAKINRTPILIFTYEVGIGIGIHISIARMSAIEGARVNIICDDDAGRIGSFKKSFSPSAMGCSNPKSPTMFGPLRFCI